jgi:two-component system secretion response regulator SsrB
MALAARSLFDRRFPLGLVAPPRQARLVTHALIVHRADVVRAGVSALLTSGASYDVTDAASVFEGLRLASASHPQVILFDFAPGEGAEACRLLAALWPRPKLIALVSRSQSVSARECLDAGADAAIAIDTVSRESFLVAIQRAVDGTGPVAAGFRSAGAFSSVISVDDGPLGVLTPREREMLYLIGEGLSNKEIADALVLSIKTVETHRSNLSRKLNVRPRAGLMRLAMTSGGLA